MLLTVPQPAVCVASQRGLPVCLHEHGCTQRLFHKQNGVMGSLGTCKGCSGTSSIGGSEITCNFHHSSQDPLVQVADEISQDIKVLCLDEVFVNDVADAALMNRLFSRLWENGLVLVATSNRAPDSLYENGLQRNLFLPFIAKLKVRSTVFACHQH